MLTNSSKKRKFQSIYNRSLLALLTIGAIAFNPIILKSVSAADSNLTPAQQTKPNFISQGRQAYQAGRYTSAKKLWQQAYQQAQDKLTQAQSLNYLALTSHKLGELEPAQEYLEQSLKLLPKDTVQQNQLQVKAQILNTQGRLELSMGKAKAALASWQQAAEIYHSLGDEVGILGVKINQAQAWRNLGLYRRAQKSLQQISQKLESPTDPSLKIAGWRNLGISLQVTGDIKLAEQILNQSLALSQKLDMTEESSSNLFSLGNTALARNNRSLAMKYYQQAEASTTQPLLKTEAQLNQLSIAVAQKQEHQAQKLVAAIKSNLSQISAIPSRKLVYLQVNLAKNLLKLTKNADKQQYLPQNQELLEKSLQQAQQLQDPQAKSYALGMLGHFYEQNQQLALSKQYTQKAAHLAQIIDNADLTYQWQWQLGRLLHDEGNRQGAIAAYTVAVEAIESLRSDLVVTNSDLQFSFRESIEPVYRQLVSLLLTPEDNSGVSQTNLLQARSTIDNAQGISQENLARARDIIEALQLAELNNFFREACLDATPKVIDDIDLKAAVIYPIILSDRLEVIVSLPDKSLSHYSHPIPQSELKLVIDELRQNLQIRSRRNFHKPSQKLYSWLINPFLADLTTHNIETLVFVPDGNLRNIPPGALHDGEKYLIEQYNVAITPGLQLLAPLPLEQVELKTLAAGITQQRRGFSSLEYVARELTEIQDRTDSLVLKDDQFTHSNLKEQIKTANYPIVHIATHGQFSSNLDDTFLLAWDNDINIQQLDELLQNADPNQQKVIELLILSACETARGDERAALGLAGMAVKAGARTTLATLWTVYDQSTAMTMNSFYQNITHSQLKPNKAHALRQAQLDLINSPRFNHPYYWAPFVMVGNWL